MTSRAEQSRTRRGVRYQQRMREAKTDKDRAYAEWQELRSDAAKALNAETVWAQVAQALRAARSQLKPRR